MLVKYLDIIQYYLDGSWDSKLIENPTRKEISDSIYKLDRNFYPFIWLHTNEPIQYEVPENSLNIVGGFGEYYLQFSLTDSYFELFDDSRPEEEVQIWESDQGFLTTKQHLCNDVDLVIAIAKYFAESGKRYPEVNWKNS